MYLPNHQYKKEKTQDVPPLKDSEGNNYKKSSVIKTSAGQFFDVPVADLALGIFTNAVQLFASKAIDNILNSDSEVQTSYDTTPIVFKPTEREMKLGITGRYFSKNLSTGKIKEVSEVDFDRKFKGTPLYEVIGILNWRLRGPVKDITVDNRVYRGAESVNRRSTQLFNREMPGITALITDFTQYVEETPADLVQKSKTRPENTSFDIPAPGRKL